MSKIFKGEIFLMPVDEQAANEDTQQEATQDTQTAEQETRDIPAVQGAIGRADEDESHQSPLSRALTELTGIADEAKYRQQSENPFIDLFKNFGAQLAAGVKWCFAAAELIGLARGPNVEGKGPGVSEVRKDNKQEAKKDKKQEKSDGPGVSQPPKQNFFAALGKRAARLFKKEPKAALPPVNGGKNVPPTIGGQPVVAALEANGNLPGAKPAAPANRPQPGGAAPNAASKPGGPRAA